MESNSAEASDRNNCLKNIATDLARRARGGQAQIMGYHTGRGKPALAQTEPAPDHRLYIHNLVKRDPLAELADDVRKGLAAQPKRFLPKYFYDELGSQLFEAICLLPEYYLTRAENEIFKRYRGRDRGFGGRADHARRDGQRQRVEDTADH